MKKFTPVKTALVIMLCVFAVVSQTWKDDSLVIRQILDTNGLNTVPVEQVVVCKDSIGVKNLDIRELPAFHILPASIGRLLKLQGFNIEHTAINNLPAEMGNLKLLLVLSISSNKLSSLPPEIGNCTSLKSITIWGEYDLKTLPLEIGKLSLLEILRISFCNISKLPDEICNLGSLKVLTLYKNQLTEIPQNIGNLSSLEGVDLYYNKLKSLPQSILKLPLPPDKFAVCFNDSLVFTPEQCSYFMIKDYRDYFYKYCPVEIEQESIVKSSTGILSHIVTKGNRIQFNLRLYTYMDIRLYDMHGRMIAQAFNGYKKAGDHSVDMNTGECGAGVLYLTIRAGQECHRKAIVMLK